MKTTVKSPSNIAIVKYWGKYGVQLPKNPSISFSLDQAFTTTELEVSEGNGSVEVYLDGESKPSFVPKIKDFIKRVGAPLLFLNKKNIKISTTNSFPHGSGIASSASGMSALAKCMAIICQEESGDSISKNTISDWARLGSGSASRSIIDSWALWGEHIKIADSSNDHAIELTDIHNNFKTIKDCILLVDKSEKEVSSTIGHQLMNNHPYAESRFEQAKLRCLELVDVLKKGDWSKFGELAESEALTLHAMMLCSKPSYILMRPNTLRVIELIRNYRKNTGYHLYFTLDAGANVHALYPEHQHKEIELFIQQNLLPLCVDEECIWDKIGVGAKVIVE